MEEREAKENATASASQMVSRNSLWGLTVYVFVFGELVDACQNRCIDWIKHCKMTLQAKTFVEMWGKYLKTAGYSEAKHYISEEVDDVVDILNHGIITLVIVYRDYLEDELYPLLLWLHLSEPCEHSFGVERGRAKDFT